jgi:hypothetical protein
MVFFITMVLMVIKTKAKRYFFLGAAEKLKITRKI